MDRQKDVAVFRGHRLPALGAFTVLLAAALLLALLTAACGGDGSSGEAALDELKALAENATEGATVKVAYTVTTTINDAATESEQIVVQRPPDYRFETSLTADDEETRSVVIDREDVRYVCLARGGDASCLDSQPSGESLQEALGQATLHLTVDHPLDIELFDMPQQLVEGADTTAPFDTSQRQIAGLDATCFGQESASFESELCFSDDALMLSWRYSEVSPDGVTRVFEAEATSVTTDVTDSDFEPPYEIAEGTRFPFP